MGFVSGGGKRARWSTGIEIKLGVVGEVAVLMGLGFQFSVFYVK
jgi:hypothetical protein